jgi:hypothetical protein
MTSPFHEPTTRHALVLLDPTHLMGETALHYVNGILDPGDRVTLAVWPAGPPARARMEFASNEASSITEVDEMYLEQVADRVECDAVTVDTVTLPRAELGDVLAGFVARSDVTDVVVPATLAGSTPGLESNVALRSGVPVTVANGQLRRRIA